MFRSSQLEDVTLTAGVAGTGATSSLLIEQNANGSIGLGNTITTTLTLDDAEMARITGWQRVTIGGAAGGGGNVNGSSALTLGAATELPPAPTTLRGSSITVEGANATINNAGLLTVRAPTINAPATDGVGTLDFPVTDDAELVG